MVTHGIDALPCLVPPCYAELLGKKGPFCRTKEEPSDEIDQSYDWESVSLPFLVLEARLPTAFLVVLRSQCGLLPLFTRRVACFIYNPHRFVRYFCLGIPHRHMLLTSPYILVLERLDATNLRRCRLVSWSFDSPLYLLIIYDQGVQETLPSDRHGSMPAVHTSFRSRRDAGRFLRVQVDRAGSVVLASKSDKGLGYSLA